MILEARSGNVVDVFHFFQLSSCCIIASDSVLVIYEIPKTIKVTRLVLLSQHVFFSGFFSFAVDVLSYSLWLCFQTGNFFR